MSEKQKQAEREAFDEYARQNLGWARTPIREAVWLAWLARAALAQQPQGDAGWNALTDEDRQAAFESLPDMFEGFMKKWGWLHFAKEIERRCREKNAAPPPAAPVAQGLIFDLDGWMGHWEVPIPIDGYEELKLALAQSAPSASAQQAEPVAAWRANVASQCRATASSDLAGQISVDAGSGTLRELLNDAADALAAPRADHSEDARQMVASAPRLRAQMSESSPLVQAHRELESASAQQAEPRCTVCGCKTTDPWIDHRGCEQIALNASSSVPVEEGICEACRGAGQIATGCDEFSESICETCEGSGIAAPAPSASPALPERDTSKPAERQGLFRKFDVRRTDGSDAPGGKHHGCRYFVLDVDHDGFAAAALGAYATACGATHPELARDLHEKWGASPVALTDEQIDAAIMESKLVTPWPKREELHAFARLIQQASTSTQSVTDAMALAFHRAISDGALGQNDVEEIKTGLRAALLAASPADQVRWTPVGERLPARNQDVIIALTTGAVLSGFYYGQSMGWDWPETDTDEDADAAVTHWMSLPSAPQPTSASKEGA